MINNKKLNKGSCTPCKVPPTDASNFKNRFDGVLKKKCNIQACTCCGTDTDTVEDIASNIQITNVVVTNVDNNSDELQVCVDWVDVLGDAKQTCSNIILTLDNQELILDGTTIGIEGGSNVIELCDLIGNVTDNSNELLNTDKIVAYNALGCELKTLTIPTHTVECLMTVNIPTPLDAVPANAPAEPIIGSTIRIEYFNGYAIYTFNGTDWDVCARDFTMGPIIQPSK